MLLATVLCGPWLSRAVLRDARPSRAIGCWLLISYAAGLYAIVPSLLLHAGVPASVCSARWMNVFLLHPLLTRMKLGGTIVATAALAALFAMQHAVVLLAIWRIDRLRRKRV
jgi:hypothetical protein